MVDAEWRPKPSIQPRQEETGRECTPEEIAEIEREMTRNDEW